MTRIPHDDERLDSVIALARLARSCEGDDRNALLNAIVVVIETRSELSEQPKESDGSGFATYSAQLLGGLASDNPEESDNESDTSGESDTHSDGAEDRDSDVSPSEGDDPIVSEESNTDESDASEEVIDAEEGEDPDRIMSPHSRGSIQVKAHQHVAGRGERSRQILDVLSTVHDDEWVSVKTLAEEYDPDSGPGDWRSGTIQPPLWKLAESGAVERKKVLEGGRRKWHYRLPSADSDDPLGGLSVTELMDRVRNGNNADESVDRIRPNRDQSYTMRDGTKTQFALFALGQATNTQPGEEWATTSVISDMTGESRKDVSAYLCKLRDRGMVQSRKKRQESRRDINEWSLTAEGKAKAVELSD